MRSNSHAEVVNVPDISTALVNAGVNFAKRHYVGTSLYVFGLIIMTFVAGFAVPPDAQAAYEKHMDMIDQGQLLRAQREMLISQEDYYESKGWFFTCDDVCTRNYHIFQEKQLKFQTLQHQADVHLSNARAKVGIFSEYAVSDARDLFWSTFGKGKEFAKNTSKYDLIFMGLSSMNRDESLVSFFVRFLFQMMVNFTLGLFGAFVAFVYYVGGIISSYQANPLAGIVFYSLSVLAAGSFVISYLVALYAAAAGTTYVVFKVAGPSFRIADVRRSQGGRLHYQ